MAEPELVTIWKQFKLIHELLYRHGISIESLQRSLDESGSEERRLYHEGQASQDYAPKHSELLRLIDDTIHRLESDGRKNEKS